MAIKLHRTEELEGHFLIFLPLLDVIFLLLLFFILNSSFVIQPGIQVKAPYSPFTLGPVQSPTIITITAPPSSQIFYKNRPISLDDLDQQLLQENLQKTDPTIIINADKTTSYDLIMEVSHHCLSLGYRVVLSTSLEPGS